MFNQPSCRKFLWENLVGNFSRENLVGNLLWENLVGNLLQEICCGKFLQKILAGKSCGTRRGKSQFKKGRDRGKFTIWNRVIGSQPIRMQLRKIFQENVVGNFLRENLVGNSCGKILWENLVGNFLRENLAGNFLWEISCIKILQEILVGKSCGKILQENLVGNFCGKFLEEILVLDADWLSLNHPMCKFM